MSGTFQIRISDTNKIESFKVRLKEDLWFRQTGVKRHILKIYCV